MSFKDILETHFGVSIDRPKSLKDLKEGDSLYGAYFPPYLGEMINAHKEMLAHAKMHWTFSMGELMESASLQENIGVKFDWEEFTIGESFLNIIRKYKETDRISGLAMALDRRSDYVNIKMFIPKGFSDDEEKVKALHRAYQEVYILTQFECDYIVEPTGFVFYPVPGLVTEYLRNSDDSITLEDVLSVERKFSIEEAVSLLQPLSRVLRLAHNDFRDPDCYSPERTSLVHRDFCPSNVMLLNDGGLKVFDWGYSKFLESSSSVSFGGAITKVGIRIGKPNYLSPEQADGVASDKLLPQTDIYSLCVLAYELMAGRSPYKGLLPIKIYPQVSSGHFTDILKVPVNKDWSRYVVETVYEGMARDPMERMPLQIMPDGRKLRGAARLEETLKQFVEDAKIKCLMSDDCYSEDAAKQVRRNLHARVIKKLKKKEVGKHF